jgi:predicted AlkP superfamily phosphohydrolase/phosphomutase
MIRRPLQKVLAIGLDSCDLEYLRCYLPHLPTLQTLLGKGTLTEVDTTATAMDASVWPTFMMGCLPGEHGYYFPFQWHAQALRYQRVVAGWLPFKPFWDSLCERGCQVGVFDMPMLPLPVQSSNQLRYYLWQTQEEGGLAYRYNDTPLGRQIEKKWGPNPLSYDIAIDKTPGQLEQLRCATMSSAETRGKIGKWLLEESDWDLFIIGFSELHRAGHYLCPNPEHNEQPLDNRDTLIDVYRAVDQAIGTLLSAHTAQNVRVIVFALHGMGPNNSQEHFVPKVLDRLFSSPASDPKAHSAASQRSPFRWLREKLPAQLQQGIARHVSQSRRDWVVNRAFTSGLDWQHIPAFRVLSGGQGYIRFNIHGREKRGWLIAGSDQHRQVKMLLKETFSSLQEAHSGKPLVKEILDIEDLYPGPFTNYLPDLSIIWHELPPAKEIYSPTLGHFSGRIGTGRGGNHRPKAFYGCDSALPEHITRRVTHISQLHRVFNQLLE